MVKLADVPRGAAFPADSKLTTGRRDHEEENQAMATREERYEAAEALKNAGDLSAAVAALETTVADHPDFALAHSALAAWCTRLDRHEEAVRHARRVCELEPNDPFSYTALSVACMRGGRIAEAEDALARSRMMQGGHA
jgi:Flp pilus assembly protein TadD